MELQGPQPPKWGRGGVGLLKTVGPPPPPTFAPGEQTRPLAHRVARGEHPCATPARRASRSAVTPGPDPDGERRSLPAPQLGVNSFKKPKGEVFRLLKC